MKGQQKNKEKLKVFSVNLNARMQRMNIQQNELAEMVGVEPSSITHWLKAENAAKPSTLRKVAEALQCDAAWLLGSTEESTPMILREGSEQAEVRRRCHSYLDRVLDACRGDKDRMSWTLVEMQQRFQLPTVDARMQDGRESANANYEQSAQETLRGALHGSAAEFDKNHSQTGGGEHSQSGDARHSDVSHSTRKKAHQAEGD